MKHEIALSVTGATKYEAHCTVAMHHEQKAEEVMAGSSSRNTPVAPKTQLSRGVLQTMLPPTPQGAVPPIGFSLGLVLVVTCIR